MATWLLLAFGLVGCCALGALGHTAASLEALGTGILQGSWPAVAGGSRLSDDAKPLCTELMARTNDSGKLLHVCTATVQTHTWARLAGRARSAEPRARPRLRCSRVGQSSALPAQSSTRTSVLTTPLNHFATDCTALAAAFREYVDQGRAQEAASAAEELEALLPRLGLGPAGPRDGTTYCNALQVDRTTPLGVLPLSFSVVRTAAASQGACCNTLRMRTAGVTV